MSIFSCKSDLFDCLNHIDKDEMIAFEKFKMATNGVIYQPRDVVVTKYNMFDVEKNNNMFEVIETDNYVDDRRTKSGKRKVVTYTYKYCGKEFKTLDEINKLGVSWYRKIEFNTLLDLIPYYPYSISVCQWGDEAYLVLSKTDFSDNYSPSSESDRIFNEYRERLQKHYIEVFEKYFNRENRKRIETLVIKEENSRLLVVTEHPIDYNFDVNVVRGKEEFIFSEPKVIDFDKGIVDVTDVFLDMKKYDTITITYTIKK